jgi:drug/metabolite transporter (DMT)-like permease
VQLRGSLYGLAAALLFGFSAPLAALLTRRSDPQALSGVLYAGAAVALLLSGRNRLGAATRVGFTRRQLPALAAVAVSGGVVAPVLLMMGLHRVGGLTGSLLLNLEAVLTIVLAVAFWRERLSMRAAVAAVLTIGAAVLVTTGGSTAASLSGVVLVAAACAAWAVDNNLTALLSAWDPLALVTVKATTAAVVNTGIAALRGAAFPRGTELVGALVLGAFAYGLSVLLDAYALRDLGAAREAALFACAPFAGAALAPLVADAHVTATTVAASVLMLAGVALLLAPERARQHDHQPVTHDHPHDHDEHHPHDHSGAVQRHAHAHRHAPLSHAHGYRPDRHH